MVRFSIAIACVSVIVSASPANAQSRTTGTRSQATPERAPSKVSGKASLPKSPMRPVSRTQDAAAPPADPAAGLAANAEAAEATVEVDDEILNQQAPEMAPELVQELDRILQFWSDASDKIDRLEGKHFRIVYDTAFEVEKQSEGAFAYEKADKGRIDIKPVEITPEVIAAREKEATAAKTEKRRSQVRVGKTGKPFMLVQEQPERWSCDGQRVYSVDMEKKEAIVAQLPADMQGKNIMDSPLPFLFGMPPEKAKRRFTIFFTGGKFDPKSGKAYLTVYPRLPQDAQTWRQADVILDLKEFLPLAVQLLDPAGTKITVYKFRDFKKNQKTFAEFLGANPKTHFTPDLRDCQVQVIGDEKPPEIPNGLVNVAGMNHQNAVIQLERQGLKRVKDDADANQIVLEAGPAASNPNDVYTVKAQDPAPGTPLKPGMKVKLTIWTDPKVAKK